MIDAIYFHGDENVAVELSDKQLAAARADPAGVLWVDLDGADPEAARRILGDVFQFHPLTVDDCLDAEQRPKIEDFDDYVFAVVRLPRGPWTRNQEERATEVDLYIGPNFLVTFHHGPVHSLQSLRRDAARDSRILSRGADDVAARCLRSLADDALDALDRMDEEIDDLELAVFGDIGQSAVQRLFRLRHDLAVMRRILGPQRDVYNRLAWDDLPAIRAETRPYYREAYDRLVQVLDVVDNRRDLTSVALETYLSVASNRLNETMRLLAALQIVFLPLALVAAIYGMNFPDMPPFGRPDGWRMVMAVMLIIGLVQYAVFRRRGWL